MELRFLGLLRPLYASFLFDPEHDDSPTSFFRLQPTVGSLLGFPVARNAPCASAPLVLSPSPPPSSSPQHLLVSFPFPPASFDSFHDTTRSFKFESSLESTVVSTWFSLRANLTDISFLAWKRNIGKSLIFLGIFLQRYHSLSLSVFNVQILLFLRFLKVE